MAEENRMIGKRLIVGMTFLVLISHLGCWGIPPKKISKGRLQSEVPETYWVAKEEEQTKTLRETLYREGEAALKGEDYDKAIASFTELLPLQPNDGDLLKKIEEAQRAKAEREAAKEKGKRSESTIEVKEYTVNLGDILDISVWQWVDLRSPEVYVRPDGKISFPLAGDIDAVGRTLSEIDQALTERLSEYIKNPEVSVSIKRFGGKKVIVLGEVRAPGVYAPTGKSTVLEVIALAGGFNNSAVTSNVMVIRGDTEKSEAIVCDLRQALKKGNLSQNIMALPNDIIFVPRRFISGVSDLASELNAQLTTIIAGVAVARDFNIHRAGN
ncbi:MAG: polysaccharide biosynthesis/export family protein [Candidatus Omnitrophota bacterium]